MGPRGGFCWLALAAALLAAATPAVAAGGRIRVDLVGDSIVEGHSTPRGDLASWVRWELERLGASVGARGYVPAHSTALTSFPWTYSAGWELEGSAFAPSPFGATGTVSQTSLSSATVTATLEGDSFGVLFTRSADAGTFSFSVDGRTARIHANSQTTDGGGVRWVSAPARALVFHTVTVHGPESGTLRFGGVIARSRATGVHSQIEVSGVGRSCACAADPLPGPRAQALQALRPDIAILMLGTNGEGEFLASGDEGIKARFLRGLEARERLFRRAGARCVVVPHAPNPRPPAVQQAFTALERQAAKREHCLFAPVLSGIWKPEASVALGLTSDGIHPMPPGYRRMSAHLARLILSLAR